MCGSLSPAPRARAVEGKRGESLQEDRDAANAPEQALLFPPVLAPQCRHARTYRRTYFQRLEKGHLRQAEERTRARPGTAEPGQPRGAAGLLHSPQFGHGAQTLTCPLSS